MRLLGMANARQNGPIKKRSGIVVTIPKDVKQHMDIKPGDKLLFCEGDTGDIILRKNGVKH